MVRFGPMTGVAAAPAGALALLAVLTSTVELSVRGWTVAIVCCAVTCVRLDAALSVRGAASLGAANRITLLRALLVCAVAGLTADALVGAGSRTATVALAAVALVLDGIDGKVARRTRTVSELGARFDMEVDAFLILALSVYASLDLGAWVLAIGLMRYAYVVAARLLPWLRTPVPPRYWRKVVAATQGIVLAVVVGAVLPHAFMTVAVAAALLLLVESFGRDVVWQARQRSSGAPQSGSGTRKSTTVPPGLPGVHVHVPPRRSARAVMSAMPLLGFASPSPWPSSAMRNHAPAGSPAMVSTMVCALE
jgi:phosphatidylglycerophosphate synthase